MSIFIPIGGGGGGEVGPQGPEGPPGPQGPQGDPGPAGAGIVDLTGSAGLTVASVAAGGASDATWAAIDRGIIILLSVTASAANNIDVLIYSAATRLPAQLLYEVVGINALASAYIDAVPFYVEDLGATQDLYVTVRNNSGVTSDITLSAYAMGE